MPARTRRVLSATFLGAVGGGVTLVLSVIATALSSPQIALGPLDVLPHAVVFVVGAVHGAAIGLAAGLGWRLFALAVGPFLFSWSPLVVLLDATAIGAEHFLNLGVYLAAGAITCAWVMRVTRRLPDHVLAHDACSMNRTEIEASDVCGCFNCLATFPAAEVDDWAGDHADEGETAACPRCGIDSVIGSKSGWPITHEFLGTMRAHCFGTP